MNIIESILLSALSAIANNSALSQVTKRDSDIFDDIDDEKINSLSKKRAFHNVARICKSGRLKMIAQHLSHSSHSSHSSHASHYSAAGDIMGGTQQTSTSINSTYAAAGTTRDYESEPRLARKAGTYNLGDVNLRKGDYGKDVDELIALLRSKKLLLKYKPKKKNGFTLYDDVLEKSIKNLQKKYKMTEDGVVTKQFIKKIENLI